MTTLVVIGCAKGTDGSGIDVGEGGIVEVDGGLRDVNVVPTPKDSSSPDDSGLLPGDDSGTCTKKVVINELKTDGTTANDEMIELYNPSSCAVPLGSWELKYESSGGGTGMAGHKFATGDSIPSKAYLVLTPTSAAAKLTPGMAKSDGQVGLLDDKGTLVDAVAYGTVTTGSYREGPSAPSPPSGGSIGRSPDGADSNNNKNDFKTYTTPSAGVANP
jgi:hypothetical protein